MNRPFWTICSPSKLSFSFYFDLSFILNLIISLDESGVITYFFIFLQVCIRIKLSPVC